jgi:hypothetical protein
LLCRLESMSGIAACSALVELYLSHNGIWSLDEQLTQLKALRVRGRCMLLNLVLRTRCCVCCWLTCLNQLCQLTVDR